MDKKRIFSGIQPTGCITIGNYIGAIDNWLKFQEEYNCIYCVVDMHSITVRQDPAQLRERAMSFLAQYIACGLSPEKSTMFFQSHVHEHAELTWVLNCNSYIGELSRMTQFKDKSAKHQTNLNMGLMDYPVLMASDILLYDTALVPVGVDQKQHVELARDIAIRFNNAYGDTFVVPEPFIPSYGAKVYSLQDPVAKMSKSDSNANATISIIEDSDSIIKKFKKAVTDSDNRIAYSPQDKPGVSNLITIYSAMTGKSIVDAELEFEGQGYGTLKMRTADAVVERLRPIREEYDRLINDKAYLLDIAYKGADKASEIASVTLKKVYDKVGFVAKK
ncbi:MAG: tryptophan--tRNA ligase [Clostridia bacterium]|nr:tryptophan--tRNA ligase [Clostridia bacterium]MBR7160004.1 tryptophan--tRNA ligase [Clostridia bacterium]